ncbi:YlxM family DNA-binding protein [Sporomusa sp.]|uniref:YlxM family DNA-binding protein n=1 Tax=Sporomusa sp. TaxID=2078658 RepID=UPI002C0F1804|nr:YlxM family DNA-binding protein [Sporomusa sp.]HWR43204.1 YlxM family DNA-binding protein [Sporomusa sp.]
MDRMLNKVLRVGQLYDFYNALLTDKQRDCLNMHYLQDLSLAEIAEEFGVSRQAVHDILRRAEQTLEEYEEKLGLAARYSDERKLLAEVVSSLEQLPITVRNMPELSQALLKLNSLLEDTREV